MSEGKKIMVLPDAVINQIAAGEVVERPASVLKELVENSLDAGARHIEVEVVDGGRRLVRIVDDGEGMDRENALLAIERHATSKLRELKDLDEIVTMGFRGEALAAIASVSQFTLTTNRAGSAVGTEILIFGGRVQEVRDAGVPAGTDIAVRNLFFNVPARRKFLRSAPTEFTHIRQAFVLEALAHPDVAFTLRADDAEVFRLPVAETLEERVRDVFGEEMGRHLRPLDFGNGVVEVGGLAGLPPFSRMDREWQVVFVNGRPAGSPMVNFAIQTAYREVLQGGRYAPLFLDIRLPRDLVDVNVHPAKKEVRFRRPTEVRDVIIEAIRLAIGGGRLTIRKRGDVAAAGAPAALPKGTGTGADERVGSGRPLAVAPPPVFAQQGGFAFPPPGRRTDGAPEAGRMGGGGGEGEKTESGRTSPWAEYRLLGRIGGQYVALETGDGLVLMDARSAHERVLFERMTRALEGEGTVSQGLLPPVTVGLSPTQMLAVKKHAEVLRKLGFGVEEFGGDTVLVSGLPVWLQDADPREVIPDFADGLMQGGKASAQDWVRPVLAELAGHQAVALRRELPEAELRALIEDLSRTEMPYTSPKGRPTVILLSMNELNRKFGRS